MTQAQVDYISKTLDELQEIHSRLCAEADGIGLELPERLTVDFDSQERGAEICLELDGLVAGSRANSGVAEGQENGHKDPGSKPAKKRVARKAASEETSSTGVSQMTDAKKAKKPSKAKKAKKPSKAKVAKKTAKKPVKKAAAKKTGVGKKTGPRADSMTSKVVALMKRAKGVTRAEVLKLTGWKAVSMQQLAKSAGVKMKVSEERPFHYMAA